MEFLIGEKLGESIELQDTLANDTYKKFNQNDILDLEDNLHKFNISLKIATLLISNEDENLELQKNKRYPTINLFASYGIERNTNDYDTKILGFKTAISLFDGNKKNLETEKAFIEKAKTIDEYESKRIILEETLIGLVIDANRYISTIDSKKKIILATQSTKELVLARYKEGLVTYIETIEAVKNENLAQKNYFQAIYERNEIVRTIDYLIKEK